MHLNTCFSKILEILVELGPGISYNTSEADSLLNTLRGHHETRTTDLQICRRNPLL
jgi:hypothetical protein